MSETKKPQAGEYWFKGSNRVRVLWPTHTGRSVTETVDGWTHHGWDFTGWHHEPRCTGWDWQEPPAEAVRTIDVSPGDGYRWLEDDEIVTPTDEVFRPDLSPCWVKPLTRAGKTVKHFDSDDYPVRRSIARTQPVEPPAIDPGEGYDFLPIDAVLEPDDEYESSDGKWIKTQAVGGHVSSQSVGKYRRKIQPAEVWPKYVVKDSWCTDAYIRRDSAAEGRIVLKDGTYSNHVHNWDLDHESFIASGSWRYVTESEALARVKPPEPEFCVSCGVHSVVPGTKECGVCIQRAIDAARCPVESAVKRVPVRLYWYDGNIVGRYEHSQPTDESFSEILHDDDGWYVEVAE